MKCPICGSPIRFYQPEDFCQGHIEGRGVLIVDKPNPFFVNIPRMLQPSAFSGCDNPTCPWHKASDDGLLFGSAMATTNHIATIRYENWVLP